MAKKLEKQFNEIASESKQSKGTSANVDMSANEAKAQKELTAREKVDAYLINHAVEHYCAATGEDPEDVRTKLESIKAAEDGTYYLFTAPVFDKDTTPEKWEELNPTCIKADKPYKTQWYKRALTVGSAVGVCRLLSALERYDEDRAKADAKRDKDIESLAKVYGLTADKLRELLESANK